MEVVPDATPMPQPQNPPSSVTSQARASWMMAAMTKQPLTREQQATQAAMSSGLQQSTQSKDQPKGQTSLF